jgi:hypothetical protein
MLVPLEDVLRARETTWPEKAIVAEWINQDGFHAKPLTARYAEENLFGAATKL